MSTDITTTSTSTSLVKRAGLIALFAVLALFMGAKFSGALISGSSSGGHSSTAAYAYGQTITLGQPTNVAIGTVSSTTGSVTVTWKNPVASGGAITSYTVTDSSGNSVLCNQTVVGALGANNSCTWTPTGSAKYAGNIRVYANAAGYTAAADTTGGVLFDLLAQPNAPTASNSVPGYITVTFAHVTAGETAGNTTNALVATGYAVLTNNTIVCTAPAAATTCTFSNTSAALVSGRNYRFSVEAINAAGYSTPSANTGDTLAVSAPDAATNVVAKVDYTYGTVDLTYTDPTNNGGGSLTPSFYVNGKSVTCGTPPTAVTATCSITINSTNFPSPFTGVITVVESNGTGTSAAQSNSITLGVVPAQPATATMVTASAGTKLVPTWTMSSYTGILGYSVQLETCSSTIIANAVCTATGSPVFVAEAGATRTYSTGFTMTGGAIYTVAVSAINVAGTGPALEANDSGIYEQYGQQVPSAPAVTVNKVTNGAITFTFTAPTYNNGSAVTGYTYQAYSVDSTALVGSPVAVTTPGQYTISGLGAYGKYAVSVVAINGAGPSGSTYAAGGGTAGYSKDMQVGAGATSLAPIYTATGVTFTWTTPAASATVDLTEATYNVVAAGTVICSSTAPATTCSASAATIQYLLAHSVTSVSVYAVDANGATNVSSNTVTLAAPAKPTVSIYTDVTTKKNIVLTWTNGSGSAASSFVITSTTSKGVQQTWTAPALSTSYTIPTASLSATLTEKFQVAAVNGAGTTASDQTGVASGATPVAKPEAPVVMIDATATAAHAAYAAAVGAKLTPVVNAGGNFVTVTWLSNTTAVAGNPVVTFTATLTEASGTVLTCTQTPAQSVLASAAAISVLGYTVPFNTIYADEGGTGTVALYGCTFAGVPANASYDYTVVADGAASSSSALADYSSSTATTASGASSPTILSAVSTAVGTGITVIFTLPKSNPSNLLGYLVTADDGAGNLYLHTAVSTNQEATIGSYVAPKLFSCLGSSYGGSATTYSCTITVGDASGTYNGFELGTKFTINVSTVDSLSGYGAITDGLALNVSTPSTTTVTTNNVPARPVAPTAVLATSTASAANVTVSYVAPTVTPASTITKYTVSFTDAGTAQSEVLSACSLGTVSGTYASVALVTVTGVNTGCEVTLAAAGYGNVYPVTMSFTSPEATVFSVKASTAAGYSVSSTSSGAIIPTLALAQPNAYAYGSIAAGYLVAWAPVVGATSYGITVTGGASLLTYSTTDTSYTVPASDLAAGNVYHIYVTSVNAGGSSDGTNEAGVATAPTAPGNFVEFDNAVIPTSQTFTWSAPTGTAAKDTLPMTYTIQETINGVVTTVATGLTATSWTTAYNPSATTYNVYGVNAAGMGAASSGTLPAFVFVAQAAPTAPTLDAGSTAVNSSSSITVAWNKGTLGLNVPLVKYTATLTSPTGTVIPCPTSTGTASTGTCTWIGLTAYTTYTYSVTNTTGAGTSTALVGTLQTKGTAPGSPSITALTKSDTLVGATYYHSVTVTWTAPTSAGASPITGYTLFLATSAANATAGTAAAWCPTVLSASATTCTITGLTGSQAYYPVLRATNAAGSSATAAKSVSGTATDYTDAKAYVITTADAAAPAAFSLKASTYTGKVSVTYPAYGSVTLSWTAPIDNAAPVTSYSCTASASNYTTVIATVAAPATSCTITGLSNAVYTIVVKAINAVGSTTATGTNNATSTAVVTKQWVNNTPINFAAVSKVGGTVTAAWIAPAVVPDSENSSPITSYIVTATDAAGNVLTKTCAAPASLCTITGASAKTDYTVTVTSVTAAGNSTVVGANVVTSLASSNPASATGLTATRTANGLSVKWTAPASLGSAAQLVGYWVSATDALTGQQFTCPYNATYGVLLAPSVSCDILGLTVGNSYTVSVTAIGVDGNLAKLLSAPVTITAAYAALTPEPVIAQFLAVTAKQKSVSALSGTAKSALNNLISSINDGAKVTVTGYGTTKAIALARANAAANYMFNNGAAVHVSIKTVISRTVKTALVAVTSN